jgi:hypothetical protein
MNRNDLRRVDMNLLVVFEAALMIERNLTRSAKSCSSPSPPSAPPSPACATRSTTNC